MTDRELVETLHARMAARRQSRERRGTAALGTGCAGLLMCLLVMVFGQDMANEGSTAGVYSGATMLFGDAGPYVAVALAAFMAGVVITAVCMRTRQRRGDSQNPERNTTEKERNRS